LLVVLVAAQIPFVYRRYQTGKRSEAIRVIQSQRQSKTDPQFNEYKGIIHAHTSLGGHSTGGFDELIDAANSNDLDFVIMTEHYSDRYDTSALTLNGTYGKTLFVGGNEVDTADSDRFLMIPGSADAAGFRYGKTVAFLTKIHAEGRLAMITYPEKFKSWTSDFDGIEVFSLNTAAKHMNPVTLLLDMLWADSATFDLAFADHFVRPDVNIRQYDDISTKRKASLFAGTDGHSNIGIHLFGVDTGGKLLNIKLDPYATVFRLARMHVRVEKGSPLTHENLISAVRSGNFYTGFDVFGDTTGFEFEAANGDQLTPMGGETAAGAGLTLRAASPVPVRFLVFKNGEKYREEPNSAELSFAPDGPGVYRVEAYQDSLGSTAARMPWIISNPIYVR